MIEVSNAEFLQALFADDAPWVHVTDFPYDPSDIPPERHLAAWKGDYFCRYRVGVGTNQYFTISNFYADDKQQARRRKALYRHTPVIVLDDVKEKLSLVEVAKLPSPSWILETSPGSEQWGYILDKPCSERAKVENLLDGLVANGLAPEGRDPGMKGVTRYVRLPEGYNTKRAKMVNGQPFKCRMLVWNPFSTTSLEKLAQPFNVDLDASRRESRVDGAKQIDDHPLLNIPDVIHIKEVRSEGRFDIVCPWVDEHTGALDNGSAIFTNGDGSIGFKCHHGACQERTGKHLLQYIEREYPGFGARFTGWQTVRAFQDIANPSAPSAPEPNFMSAPVAPVASTPSTPPAAPVAEGPTPNQVLQQVLGELRNEPPFTERARDLAERLLKSVDSLPTIEQVHWHGQVCDTMRWTKPDFKNILKDLRGRWYEEKKDQAEVSFFDDVIFVAELNQFFDRGKRIFYSAEAYQNAYSHLDAEVRKEALQGGRVTKVDRLDYAPLKPPVFEEDGVMYGNSWSEGSQPNGAQGDVSRWLSHWDAIGWGVHRDHMLQFMAYTIRHPDKKINHMLLLGSGEGVGKDFILYPLIKAMGDNHTTIAGEELLDSFNDYLLSTKHLHINETELGDRREATAVSNKLKPLAAAPPDKLRVNQKGIKQIPVRNIVSATMTTNSQMPIRLNGTSRRFFALWSDMSPRDINDEMTPYWKDYWEDRWIWMKDQGGWQACVWYLRNCVDLSTFNPGEAPPMTEFLREIKEASKPPAQQTVEAFIREGSGGFKSDLLTTRDISDTLRAGDLVAPTLMYVDSKFFTPTKVNSIMRSIQSCRSVTTGGVKIWVLRNCEKYRYMAPGDIYREYERQLQSARQQATMTVVK